MRHGFTFELIEEEGVLVFLHVLRGARLVQEERVDPLDVVHLHLGALAFPAHQAGSRDELDGIAQRGLQPDAGQNRVGVLTHLYIFFLAPDAKDLLCVFLAVGGGGDDEQTVQQVNGDAVGALVAGAPDPGDATVGSHDEDRRHVTLQGSVEEGEALNVQHVDLVDEQHARDNLCLALLPPLGHLGVDLLSDFGLDLPCVA